MNTVMPIARVIIKGVTSNSKRQSLRVTSTLSTFFSTKTQTQLNLSATVQNDGNRGKDHTESSSKGWKWAVLSVTLAAGSGAYQIYKKSTAKTNSGKYNSSPYRLVPSPVFAAEETKVAPGELKPGLPTYTLEEVSKHVSKDKGIWVIYKNGVYDITDYVNLHPGGEMILMAAGKSMEPFWEKYSIHYTDVICEMMEYFRIGNINESVKEEKSLESDVKEWMMPKRKELDIHINWPATLSIENLKRDFPRKTVITAVKCSSSKTEKKEMTWSGVALGDLFKAQGVDLEKVDSKFVVFESLQKRPDSTPFSSLYPMEMVRSLKDDILVAYEVNGEPIPPLQGQPFRVIVKGYGGGKQVKWLRKIRLSTKDEDSH